ncbi:MAG: M13 family metallopeptidase [Proteobacteria bacterium]|nr:M13 family metallopeptidase [Pseudomonadota bacterium]
MKRSVLLLAGVIVAGCAGTLAVTQTPPAAPAPHTQYGTWGFDLSAMDKSVKPGDDFFMYANGTWFNTAEIPPDRSSTGSFQNLRIQSEKRMSEIVAELEAKPADQLNVEEKKLRDLYDAFMDQKQIDARGLDPAQKDLGALQSLKTLSDVARAMGAVRYQSDVIYNMGISADDKHPTQYAVFLGQGGLGLPDRDYYLRNDAEIVATRDAYKKYLSGMLSLAGYSDADARAGKVYDLEAKIANVSWKNEDRRDADKVYNPMTLAQLRKLAPGFDWAAFFDEAKVPTTARGGDRVFIVAEKSAFPKLAKIFTSTPVAVWRDYLTLRYLHSFAAYLPKTFDDADFAFYGGVVAGNKQQLPRATRAVHLLDNSLGEALGKIYVAKYFPPEAKAKADELVSNLLKAYDADIRVIPWMTEATRQKALEKLHAFKPYIGYPDKWKDYSPYTVTRDDLVGDIQGAALFEWNRQLNRIDEKVDRDEWGMTPPTVNAYYNATQNKIVFPAAIMQPPFFDPNADDAVNYGGIGAVIGHEISHGFDDQGSKYMGDGTLKSWWTDEDRKAFTSRTDRLVAQFNEYEPLPGLKVNGKFTLGENIGDLSGVAISLKAYHLSQGGKPAPVIDGLTGDQRFFLGFAQIWRGKYRDGAMRAQVLSNEHAPPHYRAIGATRNNDDWYAAFDVQPTDKMYVAPDQRVKLW